MSCLTEEDVLAFLAPGGDVDRAAVEHHLDGCAECMELVTLASRTSFAARGSDAPAIAIDLDPGAHVGRYEILEPRGRGAMGTVYAAIDTRLDRRVAIKLVEHGDERAQIALLREAKALARITHPNVLTVYDFGAFDTRVFLAAELVEGETLAAWTATARPWRRVAEVFLAAARGLGAAHAAGLVHRDFKPANVLIGRDGSVRVCDFGLARFADTTTAARELVGTPVYMSPEQRRGELADAPADQYAFCVALHEALYGALPPVRERGGVPRWLAAIAARGLAEQPADRFPSMTALALALERGLRRRRRIVVASLAGGGAVLAAVAVLAAYRHGGSDLDDRCPAPAVASWTSAQHVALHVTFAATKLPYATALAGRVERVFDQFARRYGSARRDACLGSLVDADRALYERRTGCLDHARITFDAIAAQLVASQHPHLLNETTDLVGHLPDLDACIRPAQAYDHITAPDSALFASLARIAALSRAGNLTAAEADLATATRAATALGDKRELAEVHYVAGQIAGIRGRVDESVRILASALWEAQAVGHDALVASIADELIRQLAESGRDAEVQHYRELALATAERIGSIEARARIAARLGHADLHAGRFASAQTLLTHALALEESRVPPDPYRIGQTASELGDLYFQQNELAKAESMQRRAIALFASELGPDSPVQAVAQGNLANTLAAARRFDEARVLFARALAIYERALGPDHPNVALTLSNAAQLAVEAGDLDAARRDLERALAIYRTHGGHSTENEASALNNLGEIASVQDRVDDAIAFHEQALALRLALFGAAHPVVADSQVALANLALRRGDAATARRYCDAARTTAQHADAGATTDLLAIESCAAKVELATHHVTQAIGHLEHALAAATADADRGELAEAQFALATALPAGARARQLAEQARTAFEHEGAFRTRELAAVDAWLQRAK